MPLNRILAERWTPVGILVIGCLLGLLLTLVGAIWYGLTVPQRPNEVLSSVLIVVGAVFIMGGLLSWLNERTGGTDWQYVAGERHGE